MPLPTPVRRASLLVAGALAASTLAVTAPAAQAAPVFVDAETTLYQESGAGISSGACTANSTPVASPPVPVAENGPAATGSASVTGSSTNGGDALDNASFSAQSSSSATVQSVGGNPSVIDLSVTGSATITTALPTSACTYYSYAGSELTFRFTVTQAGFLHLTTTAPAGSYGEVEIYSDTDPGNPYFELYGYGLKFGGSNTVFLPAGSYVGDFGAYVNPSANTSRTVGGTVSVHGDFVVAGSQTEAVSGKGKKYVKFPSARSCATDQLIASITDKRKRADKIKQVKFFVNDKLVKKVRTPDKADDVKLAIADDVTADVRAQVKLFPARKGRPGKVLEVTTAYEACS